MKKIIFSLLLSMLVFTPVNAENITVDAGIVVPVEIQTDINSRKLKADDLVPVIVVRDIAINGKVIFAKGAEGYLRVFDCTKVDTWGSNWRKGASIEFDGAEIKDVTGQMRKFNFDESFKGADITVGTSISSLSSTSAHGTANAFVNANANVVNPYGQRYSAVGNVYGTKNYSENTNTMSSTFLNGHRFIGENIMIKKGHRFRIQSSKTFKVNL